MAGTSTAIVRDLVARQAREHEVDVLAVEVKGQGSRQLVRVIVDRKGGISVGACQQISRELSRQLDAVDPIGGRYTLEVTSPGVDWPLTDRVAFERVEGRPVVIQRRVGDDAPEQVRGRVVGAGASAVRIDDGATVVTVAYDDIVSATQALPW
jgi:ribosome maturation factor RimP